MVWFDCWMGGHLKFKKSEYKKNPIKVWEKYQKAIKEAIKRADWHWNRLWAIRIDYQALKEIVERQEKWFEMGWNTLDSYGRITIPNKIIDVGMTFEEQGFLSITTDDYYWPLTYDKVLNKLYSVRKYHSRAEKLEKERDHYFPNGKPKGEK